MSIWIPSQFVLADSASVNRETEYPLSGAKW